MRILEKWGGALGVLFFIGGFYAFYLEQLAAAVISILLGAIAFLLQRQARN